MSRKTIIIIRILILAAITGYVTIAFYQHQVYGGNAAPSVHALCPFGGLESLYQFFTDGNLIQKIFAGTMTLLAITVALAILFRRSFCGLLCPFGAIQEFFGTAGRKLFKKKLTVPAAIDKPLRYLKYVILLITVLYAWKTAGLWMSPYDPWSAYAHLSEGLPSVWTESAIGLILLVVTLVGSLVYDRFFCKYLCPMGAFYAVVGKVSPFKIERNTDVCINCGKCSKVCPVNIDVQHTGVVKTAECIDCQLCVLDCPVTGALEIKSGKRTIKPLIAILLVVLLFGGSIAAAQGLGFYQLTPNGEGRIEAGQSIALSDVKGYMTIKEAAEATRTPLEEFYVIFEIPADVPDSTILKEISGLVPGYSLDAIKESL